MGYPEAPKSREQPSGPVTTHHPIPGNKQASHSAQGSNSSVFQMTQDVLDDVYRGRNLSIFAYSIFFKHNQYYWQIRLVQLKTMKIPSRSKCPAAMGTTPAVLSDLAQEQKWC